VVWEAFRIAAMPRRSVESARGRLRRDPHLIGYSRARATHVGLFGVHALCCLYSPLSRARLDSFGSSSCGCDDAAVRCLVAPFPDRATARKVWLLQPP
jgi:hypothetical protein